MEHDRVNHFLDIQPHFGVIRRFAICKIIYLIPHYRYLSLSVCLPSDAGSSRIDPVSLKMPACPRMIDRFLDRHSIVVGATEH